GTSGALVWDSGNELEAQVNSAGLYDDDRSDDKGVEPEGAVVGYVSGNPIGFIGLERVDAVAVYDLSDPSEPTFLSLLEAGDAPEGLVFISAAQSPTRRSLLVVSSEDDGTVKVYETQN
ncbi:MAG: alkaline phosphatase, partial [Bacteroidota bacterium]